MSGVSAPVVWAVVIVMAIAWLYHVVTEHHCHQVLLHVVRPSVVVLPATHDSRWHALSHPRRLAVNALLTGAAILLGLAWELSPYAVAAIITGAGVTALVLGFVRRAGRNPGQREIRVTEGSKP